jgi:hypothetical protein
MRLAVVLLNSVFTIKITAEFRRLLITAIVILSVWLASQLTVTVVALFRRKLNVPALNQRSKILFGSSLFDSKLGLRLF